MKNIYEKFNFLLPQIVQNSFMTIVETPELAILFFKIRPNILPRQTFLMMNMSCNLRTLPIIPFTLGPQNV